MNISFVMNISFLLKTFLIKLSISNVDISFDIPSIVRMSFPYLEPEIIFKIGMDVLPFVPLTPCGLSNLLVIFV